MRYSFSTAILMAFIAFVGVSPVDVYRVPIKKITSTASYDYHNATIYNDIADTGEALLTSQRNGDHVKFSRERGLLVGPVTIGLPLPADPITEAKNTFQMIFDTGSAELWLFGSKSSKALERSGDRRGAGFTHNWYVPETSSTYQPYDVPNANEFSIEYIDGANYAGHMGLETVEIGSHIQIDNVAFAVVDGLPEDLPHGHIAEHNEFDGSFGLAIPKETRNRGVPPFMKMVEGGELQDSVFSFHFDKDGVEGEVIFGGVDASLFIPPMAYERLVENKHGLWVVALQAVKLGEKVIHSSDSSSGDGGRSSGRLAAVIDSGSTEFSAPPSVLTHIKNLSTKHTTFCGGAVCIKCSERQALPDLEFVMGNGEIYSFTSEEYFPIKRDGSTCRLFIDPMGGMEGKDHVPWVFGIPFMKKYYTVFDYGNQQIGFARTKEEHA